MGRLYSVRCPCGYAQNDLLAGSLEENGSPECCPAYCSDGAHVVSIDMSTGKCSNKTHVSPPTPYTDPRLVGPRGYLCPKCREFTLLFSLDALID